MGDMSCYTCAYSYIEASTGYTVCKKFFLEKYVTPCNVCDQYKRKRYDGIKEAEQEEEKEVDIKVVDSEYSLYRQRVDGNIMCGNGTGENRENIEKDSNEFGSTERYGKHATECIEEMEYVFGIDAVIAFCKCNVWKYRYRATCEEDMEKADNYMEKLIELEEKKWNMENQG